MTTPTFATSRPAALTGTVGRGGANRPHDVALIQALLGTKKDKRTRPYLRGHVTGRFDPETAQALQRFRADAGDTNAARPLGPRGPMLGKLAQGQALAVLAGTTVPFARATLPGPGRIAGPAAGHLDAARKAELEALLGALAEDWALAFDAEVAVAAANVPKRTDSLLLLFESRPLVARFLPRSLAIHDGARLSPVASATMLRARAKALYEALGDDISARCANAFAVSDPVDLKIQQGVKDELACVVRTDLESVSALSQFFVQEFKRKGFSLAAQFFEHYLSASGAPIAIARDDALEFERVRNAAQKNNERFRVNNLIAPNPDNPAFLAVDEISKNPNATVKRFEDHWKVDFQFNEIELGFFFFVGSLADPKAGSLAFGPGNSNLTSTGEFLLQREGDRITVTGVIEHEWVDADGYNFNPGTPFHPEWHRFLNATGKQSHLSGGPNGKRRWTASYRSRTSSP